MKIKDFLKKEIVLVIALFLAFVAVILVKPTPQKIISSIDFRVLSLLFCLMILIQAFRSLNVLDAIACFMLRSCKSIRSLFFILVFLVFLFSMVITNDVALLTFVPLSLIICKKANLNKNRLLIIQLIVLETLAANLGSSITPMGNPQNLYLYTFYNMSTSTFFLSTLSIALPSIFLLSFSLLLITRENKKDQLSVNLEKIKVLNPTRIVIYCIVLITVLLSVFKILDYKISLVITILVLALCNIKLFLSVDYSLLFTFTGFFIFTGCISSVPEISTFLSSILKTPFSCYITGILTSQVISNVPAVLLLSGFTNLQIPLLLAANVGGMGTLIASLASVISYKLYKADADSTNTTNNDTQIIFQSSNIVQNKKKPVSYLSVFTGFNIVFLAIIGILVWLLFPITGCL